MRCLCLLYCFNEGNFFLPCVFCFLVSFQPNGGFIIVFTFSLSTMLPYFFLCDSIPITIQFALFSCSSVPTRLSTGDMLVYFSPCVQTLLTTSQLIWRAFTYLWRYLIIFSAMCVSQIQCLISTRYAALTCCFHCSLI